MWRGCPHSNRAALISRGRAPSDTQLARGESKTRSATVGARINPLRERFGSALREEHEAALVALNVRVHTDRQSASSRRFYPNSCAAVLHRNSNSAVGSAGTSISQRFDGYRPRARPVDSRLESVRFDTPIPQKKFQQSGVGDQRKLLSSGMSDRVLATFHTTLNPLDSYKLFLNYSIIVPNWRRYLDYRSQTLFDYLNRIALRSSKPEAGDSLRTVRGSHPARSRRWPRIRSQSDRTVESSVLEEFFALHLVPERIERLRDTRYVVVFRRHRHPSMFSRPVINSCTSITPSIWSVSFASSCRLMIRDVHVRRISS